MGRVFVQFGGDMRVEGDFETVKILIEDHIRSRIEAHSGAVITNASDQLYEHIVDSVAKYPWTGTITLPKRSDWDDKGGEFRLQTAFHFDQAAE